MAAYKNGLFHLFLGDCRKYSRAQQTPLGTELAVRANQCYQTLPVLVLFCSSPNEVLLKETPPTITIHVFVGGGVLLEGLCSITALAERHINALDRHYHTVVNPVGL